MLSIFRAFKYSSTNPSLQVSKSTNPSSVPSTEITWYNFFSEKNRTIKIIFTESNKMETKLEVESIECTNVYLIDYIDLRQAKNFSTNISENVLYVSFFEKFHRKFQVTFYSTSEADIFNERINAVVFEIENEKNSKELLLSPAGNTDTIKSSEFQPPEPENIKDFELVQEITEKPQKTAIEVEKSISEKSIKKTIIEEEKCIPKANKIKLDDISQFVAEMFSIGGHNPADGLKKCENYVRRRRRRKIREFIDGMNEIIDRFKGC